MLKQTTSIVLTALLLASCAEDATVIDLFIETTADVASMDQVRLTIHAASPDDRTCVTTPLLMGVDSENDFPLYVQIERGSVFTAHAMFVVQAYNGTVSVSEPRMGWEAWVDGESVEKTLILDVECFDRADPCGEGEHCAQGVCLIPRLPEIYDDPEALDESLYCSRALNLHGE